MRQWLIHGYLDEDLLVGSGIAPTYEHDGGQITHVEPPDAQDPEVRGRNGTVGTEGTDEKKGRGGTKRREGGGRTGDR